MPLNTFGVGQGFHCRGSAVSHPCFTGNAPFHLGRTAGVFVRGVRDSSQED